MLIPSYKDDKTVIETIMSVLSQSYPQRLFDVIVISDHQEEMTNFRLAQLPVTLLTPNFQNSTKARSLQFAINNLPQFKIYDLVVVLDAGDIVDQEFLHEMNDAYEVAEHRFAENGTFTAYMTDRFTKSRIDHILVTKNFKVRRYGVLTNAYWTPREDSVEHGSSNTSREFRMARFDRRMPSDHYPVFAKIEYHK